MAASAAAASAVAQSEPGSVAIVVTRSSSTPAARSASAQAASESLGRGKHDAPRGVGLGDPGSGRLLKSLLVLNGQHERDALQRIDPMRHAVKPRRAVSDLGLDPTALEVRGDRVARRDVRVGLGVAACRRAGVDAPVVQDLRDMGDPVGALHEAQDHVDVLGAVELGAKPADLGDQRASVDAEMARVAVGPQRVRRPAGLEVQPDLTTIHDDVLVGVDHVEVWMSSDLVGDPLEGVGGERVIVVKQSDVSAGGELEGGVGGGRDAPGLGAPREVNAGVGGGVALERGDDLEIGGPVVDKHSSQLPKVWERLTRSPPRASGAVGRGRGQDRDQRRVRRPAIRVWMGTEASASGLRAERPRRRGRRSQARPRPRVPTNGRRPQSGVDPEPQSRCSTPAVRS